MKVVLITEKYPFGQREQFLDAEITYCKNNHIELDIIPQDGDKSDGCRELPSNVSLLSIGNIRKFSFRHIKCAVQALFSPLFWKEIINQKGNAKAVMYKEKTAYRYLMKSLYIRDKLIKLYMEELQNHPDEIAFYTYWMKESAFAIASLKKQFNCKAISRVHGFDLYVERHKYSYLPFHEYVVRNLDAIYPVTEAGKTYLTNLYGEQNNVAVRYLGTEDYGISPMVSTDVYTIFSCSNVIPIKRVELIAEAIKLLDDKRIRWVHFGDGALLGKVESITRSIKNAECILAGRKTHQEVFEFYLNNQVDLFVNVSTTEGLPVSIMEAMSFGVPTVATDVGGTYEIVKNGINGKLIDSDIDAEELAKVIRSIMEESAEEKQEMRKQARITWETKFSSKTAFSRFYNEVFEFYE